MPELRTRVQQPQPVPPQIEVPKDFPDIPQSVLDRFPEAVEWQRRLDTFWSQTNQALQEAFSNVALQVNSQVVFTVDRFLINVNGVATPMFSVDSGGVQLGGVFYVNRDQRKIYIGGGEWNDANTPFYADFEGFFSLGSALTWNPETNALSVTGSITATSGTIGGFEIGSDYIRDTANSFGLASTVTGGNDIRFWAGATFANRSNAPLKIYEAGQIVIGAGGTASDNIVFLISAAITGSAGAARIITSSGTITAGANGNALHNIYLGTSLVNGGFTGLTGHGIEITIGTGGAGSFSSVFGLKVTGVAVSNTTNLYGVHIDGISGATNNWGLYVATTARNYMAGDLTVASIGATTPGTGAFTTLSATVAGGLAISLISSNATGVYGRIRVNGVDRGYFGSGDQVIASGAATDVGLTSNGGGVVIGASDASGFGRFSSTGLAITGGLSVTGLAGVGTRNVVVDAAGVMSAP